MSPKGSITAYPNPIIVKDFSRLGAALIKWDSLETEKVEIRIGKPDGPLFAQTGPSGSCMTEAWVQNGMSFYLQDVSNGKPLNYKNTLAKVNIEVISKPLIKPEAWSWVQMGSKLWLCNILEKIIPNKMSNSTIWILGGWYGILAFLLLSREKIQIHQICSFDLNPDCKPIANAINNFWFEERKFMAFDEDVNRLSYTETSRYSSKKPDVVINTSCEHILNQTWFNIIPKGTLLILQSTNIEDPDHINCVNSIDELKKKYPLNVCCFEECLHLENKKCGFNRFMIAGLK
jgi:hypothetical protein